MAASSDVRLDDRETVTDLKWSADGRSLAATCWAGGVTVVFVDGTAPVRHASSDVLLSCAWNDEGDTLFCGDGQGRVHCFHVTELGLRPQFAFEAHGSAASCLRMGSGGTLVTAGWDRTLALWDTNRPGPPELLTRTALLGKAYRMDVSEKMIAVAVSPLDDSERSAVQFCPFPSSRGAPLALQRTKTNLRYLSSSLCLFADSTGFLLGSVEGRCAVGHFDAAQQSKNFIFKCHRQGNTAYACSAVAMHRLGTFATGGGDGVCCFWNKDKKTRLRILTSRTPSVPVTAAAFNPQGDTFAYATGTDWSHGQQSIRHPTTILFESVDSSAMHP